LFSQQILCIVGNAGEIVKFFDTLLIDCYYNHVFDIWVSGLVHDCLTIIESFKFLRLVCGITQFKHNINRHFGLVRYEFGLGVLESVQKLKS